MRILHLVSVEALTGAADPALGLASAQMRHFGHQVSFACDRGRAGNLADSARAAGVAVRDDLTLCTQGLPWAAFADWRRLRELAGSFDLVHAHRAHEHALCALARGRARLVRTIHHGRATQRRGLEGWMYGRTDAIICIAEVHRAALLASYPGLDPGRVSLVRGAVDTERFHPGVDGEAIRRELGIRGDAFVFGIISRIKPGRGHELLIEAFGEVLRRAPPAGPPLRLGLIGRGEGLPAIRAQVVAAGLEEQVVHYGYREADLCAAIRSCDVTVLLAEGNDASCRAVMQSLASGVPVLGARLPAIVDVLESADAGLLFDAGQKDALTGAMLQAIGADAATHARWRRQARARIETAYTDRLRAEATEAVYARTLSAAPRGRA